MTAAGAGSGQQNAAQMVDPFYIRQPDCHHVLAAFESCLCFLSSGSAENHSHPCCVYCGPNGMGIGCVPLLPHCVLLLVGGQLTRVWVA